MPTQNFTSELAFIMESSYHDKTRTRSPPEVPSKEQYDSVSESETSDTPFLPDREQRPRGRRSRCTIPLLACIVILLAFSTTITIISSVSISRLRKALVTPSQSNHQQEPSNSTPSASSHTVPWMDHSHPEVSPSGQEFGHCGHNNNITEARALGCLFDPASWIWVQPACYRSELISDFLNRTELHFYRTNSLRPEDEIPREEWMRGDYTRVYGGLDYHVAHCTFNYRKIHTAYLNHEPLDSSAGAMSHSNHCEMAIFDTTNVEWLDRCKKRRNGCVSTLTAAFTKCGWY